MSQDDEGDLSVAPRPLATEHYIARGPKAVAVQRGTDLLAIGEGDRGGAVPRLHSGLMILVEGATLFRYGSTAVPWRY